MSSTASNRAKRTNLGDLIDYYEVCNRSEDKSPKTISWYSANLKHFHGYLKFRHLPDSVEKLDIRIIREYVTYLLKRSRLNDEGHVYGEAKLLSPATVHGHVRTLRAFFAWLSEEGFLEGNIAQGLKPPRVPKRVITTLSDEEIRAILNTFYPKDPISVRNQTIFMILLDTGLRIGELINLKVDDIHSNEGFLKVMGKGRKERIVPIGNNAQKAVQKYLFRYRPKPACVGIDNVFLSVHGKPLTENSMKLMFVRLAKRSGVRRLHAHLCRHTFATRFLTNGGDIFSLQQILGHSTLEMVRHYANLASSHVLVQHQKFSPLDRLNLGKT